MIKFIVAPALVEKRAIKLRKKPSTAKCDLNIYTSFLIAEPKYGGCSRLAEIFGISHYSVNRFLLREKYNPKDLFEENKSLINLTGGTLSADDTVIEKLYSNLNSSKLIGYYWSGKHQKTIKGINLITLDYTIDSLKIPDDGLIVELKNFGKVKVFKRVFARRNYSLLRFVSNR